MPAGGDKILAEHVTWPPPVQAIETTDQVGIVSSTPATGSPVCGLTFVAPTSGRVRVHVGGSPRITATPAGAAYLGVMVRTGAVIGSGTLVFDGVNTEPGCRIAYSGFLGYVGMSMSALLEGLTAGATYNAYTMHLAGSGATVTILNRQVGVDPLP